MLRAYQQKSLQIKQSTFTVASGKKELLTSWIRIKHGVYQTKRMFYHHWGNGGILLETLSHISWQALSLLKVKTENTKAPAQHDKLVLFGASLPDWIRCALVFIKLFSLAFWQISKINCSVYTLYWTMARLLALFREKTIIEHSALPLESIKGTHLLHALLNFQILLKGEVTAT